MLTLYYQPTCPYSLRVRVMLAEKRLPFSRRVIQSRDQPAELVELSGGQVPVLLDGSLAVTDSAIIAEYLEDAFTKPALRPFDARGRAIIRLAMKHIDSEITAPMTAWEDADKKRDKGELARILEPLAVWEQKLGDNGLLFGMEFSVADAWLVAAIEKAIALGYALPDKWQKTHLWLSRMRERVSVSAERLSPED